MMGGVGWRVPSLYRAMKETDDGLPEVAASARALGVRPGVDVPATAADELVEPGTGGLSVSPSAPDNLPRHRRPSEFGGTGIDPVWVVSDAEIGPRLRYRPDPDNSRHGFIEPADALPLIEYQRAIAGTQRHWRKVVGTT